MGVLSRRRAKAAHRTSKVRVGSWLVWAWPSRRRTRKAGAAGRSPASCQAEPRSRRGLDSRLRPLPWAPHSGSKPSTCQLWLPSLRTVRAWQSRKGAEEVVSLGVEEWRGGTSGPSGRPSPTYGWARPLARALAPQQAPGGRGRSRRAVWHTAGDLWARLLAPSPLQPRAGVRVATSSSQSGCGVASGLLPAGTRHTRRLRRRRVRRATSRSTAAQQPPLH